MPVKWANSGWDHKLDGLEVKSKRIVYEIFLKEVIQVKYFDYCCQICEVLYDTLIVFESKYSCIVLRSPHILWNAQS